MESGHIRLSGHLPIDPCQDIAADSCGDERHIRYSENNVLKCFELPAAELDLVDVMAMLSGISKRRAQKGLKVLLRRRIARRKEGRVLVHFKAWLLT